MEKLRRALPIAAASIVLGACLAAGGWWLWLKPQRETARKRFATLQDVMELYDLQIAHKKARGVYANDLESLVSLSPKGAALKARMAGHLDLNTLAVVGDNARFKIEANVLDAERTLVKIRGPVRDRKPGTDKEPATRTETVSDQDQGSPLKVR